MRRLSIKWKLTLLYTVCMVLITCTAMAVLLSLSSRELLLSVQGELKRRVEKGMEDLSADDGRLALDSDFYALGGGVYLSLYRPDGFFLYGKVPYGFDNQPELSDGEVQMIRGEEERWYVYDLFCELEGYGPLFIRGVASLTDAEQSLRITERLALLLMPLLVAVAGVFCYRMTRRTLLPVRAMTDTVLRIQSGRDLSCRVRRGEKGSGEAGDEFERLAFTFDGMLQKLEDAFAREKQFTSDAAHELRTPVSVILAQCDACLAQEGFTDEQRGQIGLIRKKAEGMSRLLSQLLFLARADQGRLSLQKEWVDVSALTAAAAEEQELVAQEKGIAFRTDIQPGVYAEVDEILYVRLLVNLLSNAAAYGREGGQVTVRLRAEGDELRGSVADDGAGMDAQTLAHIWERFYRGEASRSEGSHAGLGLSMAYWIVKAHGGWIEARSVPGEGSEFCFGLPLQENKKI